jgi:hypothetical protein
MITEALIMAAILVPSGLLTWAAMRKYHRNIEERIQQIEAHDIELELAEKRSGR